MNKTVPLQNAFHGASDGARVLIGGFGDAGYPFELVDALADTTLTGLTLISNNAGHASAGVRRLISERRVDRIICSYPVRDEPTLVGALLAGELELEIVPQGTLAERIRAAGAGVRAFFTPTGAGTDLTAGREARMFNGTECVLEEALDADIALVKATVADTQGNLYFRAATQNFNPVMAMAGRITIAQAATVCAAGQLTAEDVHTPGIFVQRVVAVDSEQEAA